MSRAEAQSSTPASTAPDWVTKASLPDWAPRWAKVALRPRPGTMMPRQFGPTMRSRCGRAASSIAWRRRLAAGGGALAEAGGDDHRRLGAAGAERGDEAGHGVGWRGDDREVGRLRQAGDVRVARFAVDGGVLRVDQHDPPGKAAARRLRASTAPTEAGDRWPRIGPPNRSEEMIEVADGQRAAPSDYKPIFKLPLTDENGAWEATSCTCPRSGSASLARGRPASGSAGRSALGWRYGPGTMGTAVGP